MSSAGVGARVGAAGVEAADKPLPERDTAPPRTAPPPPAAGGSPRGDRGLLDLDLDLLRRGLPTALFKSSDLNDGVRRTSVLPGSRSAGGGRGAAPAAGGSRRPGLGGAEAPGVAACHPLVSAAHFVGLSRSTSGPCIPSTWYLQASSCSICCARRRHAASSDAHCAASTLISTMHSRPDAASTPAWTGCLEAACCRRAACRVSRLPAGGPAPSAAATCASSRPRTTPSACETKSKATV